MKYFKDYFWHNLKSFSGQTACIDTESDKVISYSELEEDALNISENIKLSSKGIVFLFTSNNYASVAAYTGILKSGNCVLLLDEKLNFRIRKELTGIYQPEFIFTSARSVPEGYHNYSKFESLIFYKRDSLIPGKIFPETGVLLSTSGTTGSPKLVRLTYKNIQSNAESIAEYLHISKIDRPLTTLPINYSYGLSVINSHLLKGAAIVLTDKSVLFRDFWDLFNRMNCTSFAGVPYTYTMLKRNNFDRILLPTLKTMTQAGGKLSEEFIRYFNNYAIKNNVRFYIMYGQTEATARISYVPTEKLNDKIGSIGIPVPGGTMKIVNDGIEIDSPDITGEIVYQGNNVMLGYAECRDDLARGDELNNVLFTGDLGYKDVDGFFYVTGRMKRFIKIFGLRINLDEIQKMIENHFGISAACSGKDDLLRVLIQSKDALTEINVKNEILKVYKLNFKTVVVKLTDAIPTNSSGKYDYQKINEIFDH